MKIKIDQEKCIGCGSCTAVCSDVFEISDESKAVLKDSGVSQGEANHDCIKEAADICPVQAIEVGE
jgi:ferredoxin